MQLITVFFLELWRLCSTMFTEWTRKYLVYPILDYYRWIFMRPTISETFLLDFGPRLNRKYSRNISMTVLYHDSQFLIVDKPYDVVINSNRLNTPNENLTVDQILRKQFPRHDSFRNVHQLDYSTSGIYCFALNGKAAGDASMLFRNRHVKKTYTAILRGHVDLTKVLAECEGASIWKGNESMILVNLPIGDASEDRKLVEMKVNGFNPKHAETIVEILKIGYFGRQPVTLVKLSPITGRTHQLRLHTLAIGHPIVGDLMYERPYTPAHRMMLHASSIKFEFQRLLDSKKPTGYLNTVHIKTFAETIKTIYFKKDLSWSSAFKPTVKAARQLVKSLRNSILIQPSRSEELEINIGHPFDSLVRNEAFDLQDEHFSEEAAYRSERYELFYNEAICGKHTGRHHKLTE